MLTLRSVGVDLGFVRGEQPLAHADAHVAAQARIAVALHLAGVALDVDRRVLGVVLPRARRAAGPAPRGCGTARPRHARPARDRDQEADRAQNEQPSAFARVSGGRLHRPDYNYSPRADPTFRGHACTTNAETTRGSPGCAPGCGTGLGFGEFELAPASADASFRRYFRVTRPGGSLIVMDAPPDKEDRRTRTCASPGCWARSACTRRACSSATPTDGFLLLTDLGLDDLPAGAGRTAGAPMRSTAMRSTHWSQIQGRGARHARAAAALRREAAAGSR